MSFVLVFLSSILLWASFPPVNAWPLAWVALVPLLAALDRVTSTRAAFGRAYLSGLVFFILSLSWIHYVTTPGLLLMAAYLALYFGVFGVVYYFFRPRVGFLFFSLLMAAAWASLEYARATALTGFGWVSLGHTQGILNSRLLLAAFFGVAGVSFLVVLVNHLIKGVFVPDSRPRALLLGVILLAGLGLALAAVPAGRAVHDQGGFKAALIQPDIALAEAWDPLLKAAVVHRQIELSRQALVQDPQLIIWPETAFPNFTWDRPDLLEDIKSFARQSRVYVLFGAVTRKAGDHYFNSAVLVSPQGRVLATRSKRHLVLFGEYIPFRKELPFLQDLVPIDDFTPGGEEALFDAPGLGRFGVLICFEDTISSLARRYTNEGAAFLVNMTNDAWFHDSGQPRLHLDNARFRSVENGRMLLRSTNTGESCAVDAGGRDVACVQDNQGRRVLKAGFVVVSVYPEDKMTWYTKCGEWFVLLCVAVLAAGLVAAFRRKKPAVSVSNKILLIDDERTLHVMLKPILGSYGFDVISAMNGEDGLALAAAEKPALILLDVIMPTIKGREVCKRLKASSVTANIPVLFLTAKDSDDDVKAEMAAGAAGHVTKPINSASLVRLIKKTMAS